MSIDFASSIETARKLDAEKPEDVSGESQCRIMHQDISKIDATPVSANYHTYFIFPSSCTCTCTHLITL
jgi:hypothetical protein